MARLSALELISFSKNLLKKFGELFLEIDFGNFRTSEHQCVNFMLGLLVHCWIIQYASFFQTYKVMVKAFNVFLQMHWPE